MSRVAFVTGASRGIGRATAVALANRGDRVAFCYATDADGATETLEQVEAAGAEGLAIVADVADPTAVEGAFSAVEARFGPVEVLVNNAGVNRDGPLVKMSDERWEAVLRTDLFGPFYTIRRATKTMMRARFGRIVNVSSVGAHVGGFGQANYASAKAGLLGLARSVARELGPRGITCNVVAPGPIVTSMTERMGQEWIDTVAGQVPLRRFGTPEECATVIAFLCSDAAGYVTGALVPVDGGLGMGH